MSCKGVPIERWGHRVVSQLRTPDETRYPLPTVSFEGD